MRDVVRAGYDAGNYADLFREGKTLSAFERRFFDALMSVVPWRPTVLDLGCGPGIPYDRFLVDHGSEVTGVDLSRKHVEEARRNVAEATFVEADFSAIDLGRSPSTR